MMMGALSVNRQLFHLVWYKSSIKQVSDENDTKRR